MGDGFEVDADRLADRATQFEPLVGRLNKIHGNLQDALSTDGACWGSDAVGQSFAAVHAGPADDTVTRLAGLSDRLTSVRTRLTETASEYQSGDQAAVENLNATER